MTVVTALIIAVAVALLVWIALEFVFAREKR